MSPTAQFLDSAGAVKVFSDQSFPKSNSYGLDFRGKTARNYACLPIFVTEPQKRLFFLI